MKPDWQTEDGAVQLYLGDCRDVLRSLEVSVNTVLTDPPYGIVNQFGEAMAHDRGKRRLQFAWDDPGTIERVLEAIDLAISRCEKSAAVFVFCGGDQFGRLLEVVRAGSFVVKPAIWVKECPPPAGKGNWWPSGFEFALYGYRNSPFFGDTDPKRSNVFVADSYRYGQPGKVDHPTQKPLGLIIRLAAAIVPPEGVALDCFMGSGTTGVACVRLGRRFIGIEKERKYFDIAVKRIEAELNRAPLFDKPPQIQRTFLGANA